MSENRYETPQEAEAAFYAAFIKRDVNAMMEVWAADENISCIHPLGPILTGRTAVRESWEAVFRNSPEMQIMINGRPARAVRIVGDSHRRGTYPRRQRTAGHADARDQRLPSHRHRLAHGAAPRLALAAAVEDRHADTALISIIFVTADERRWTQIKDS